MAKSNGKRKGGKGRRRGDDGGFIRGLLILAVIVLVLGAWYNVSRKTFDARMEGIGLTAGDTR